MGSDTVVLTTSDGVRLEGDLLRATTPRVRGAAVVCHPHPLHGGDRFNAVVDAVWRRLPTVGWHALRFDFRGTGHSEGRFGGGVDEQRDVIAAIERLASETDEPIWLVGYSFGAMVSLAITHPRLAGWVGIAAPLAAMDLGDLPAATDERPVLVLTPEHDQLGPPDVIAPIVDAWTTTTLIAVEMADHSLVGRTAMVADDVCRFVADHSPAP